ncbi:MAG: phage antirepressor N-terminal domain-containing protein [Anaerolineae bacterium]
MEKSIADSDALTPIEEKVLEFYDDLLIAVRLDDGSIFVPLRRLCDNLGLDWRSQLARVRRDDVLSEGFRLPPRQRQKVLKKGEKPPP